jgi:hypothetical protein
MDLIFDAQVLTHRRAEDSLPEPVLASIAGYYHRATTTSRPMSHVIALVMVILLSALAFRAAYGRDPGWLVVTSAVLAGLPIQLDTYGPQRGSIRQPLGQSGRTDSPREVRLPGTSAVLRVHARFPHPVASRLPADLQARISDWTRRMVRHMPLRHADPTKKQGPVRGGSCPADWSRPLCPRASRPGRPSEY